MTEEPISLFVGTYAESGGEGLYPLACEGARWTLGEPERCAKDVSFGAAMPSAGLHYLLHERSRGALGMFRQAEGRWQPVARVPTCGAEPCYVSLSGDGRWLAVTNYGSGSLALFRPDGESGLVGDPVTLRQNHGRGPNAERQDGPHAHCAVFAPDGQWLYQTDLGTDEVLAFRLEDNGLGERRVAHRAPAGSGPRHLVFHPREPIAVLVSELASTLTVFAVGDGSLTARQTITTLPPGFAGESLGGHVDFAASGERIYVTNRGHDSIAAIALEGGELHLLSHTPSGGKSPRFFLQLEAARTMLVANEGGNSVTVFDVHGDGTLSQCGEVAVPGPAFIFAAK